MNDHSFPAFFSKSTLTTSTKVRLLPIREQVGCMLPSREDTSGGVFIPPMNDNLLLSGAHSEPVTSVWGE